MLPVGQETAEDLQPAWAAQETEQGNRQADGVGRPGPPSPVPIFRAGLSEDLSSVLAPVALPF